MLFAVVPISSLDGLSPGFTPPCRGLSEPLISGWGSFDGCNGKASTVENEFDVEGKSTFINFPAGSYASPASFL